MLSASAATSLTRGAPSPRTADGDTRRKRRAFEDLISSTIVSLGQLPPNTPATDRRYIAADAFLLSYKRYVSPKRFASKLFHELEGSVTSVRLSQAVGCVRLLNAWIRCQTDVMFLEKHEKLFGTIFRLAHSSDEELRFSANRVKLSLLWARNAKRRKKDALRYDALETSSFKLWMNTPEIIADVLTAIEHALFASIPLADFNNKGWSDPNMSCSRKLKAFIERSNRMSQWAASNILIQPTAMSQARVFGKFVVMAKRLEELGNYSTCAAILLGCNKHWVSRLFKLWKVPRGHRLVWDYLQNLLSPEKAYAKYRTLVERRGTEPLVPNVAVILRDLTFVEDANPDSLPDGSINSAKLDLLYNVLYLVRAAQLRFYTNLKVAAAPKGLRQHLERLPSRTEAYLEKRSKEIRAAASGTDTPTDCSLAQSETSSDPDDASSHHSGDDALADMVNDSGRDGSSQSLVSPS